MSFDWSEYLTLAQEVVVMRRSAVSEEARWRSALSRAYYAVYHQALPIAHRDGYIVPRTGSVHAALVFYFQNHRDPRWVAAGDELNQLRVRRQRADYDDQFRPAGELTQDKVVLTLAAARSLQADLSAL